LGAGTRTGGKKPLKVKLFPTISIARKRLIGQVLLFGLIEEVGFGWPNNRKEQAEVPDTWIRD